MNYSPINLKLMLLILILALMPLACKTNEPKPDTENTQLPFDLPQENITRFTLDNGLEVMIVEKHVAPIVTVLTAVKNGALAESPEFNGLSHLYEHMFFKGNETYPNQEAYMEKLRELGISFNATTSTESVQYFYTLPKENLDSALSFMRDALVTPKFEEGELHKEISTVLSEYDRNESSPFFFLRRAMTYNLYYAYPTRKDVLGNRQVIQTATREKMLTIKNRYYVPNNSLLVVSGDVDPAKVRPMIEKYFLAWPKSKNPYDLYPVPEHPDLPENKTIVVEKPYNNAVIQFQWKGPGITKDVNATYAADVFSYILSQKASAFYKSLVDSGILHGASLSYLTQRYAGPINLTGVASYENTFQAIEKMKAEIDKFTSPDYYTEEELQNAKLQLAVESLYEWQKSDSMAKTLGFWWCVADTNYKFNYVANINKITRHQIKDYLEKYITENPYVLGILISPENSAKLKLKEKLNLKGKEVSK